jgi:hypothetical protein
MDRGDGRLVQDALGPLHRPCGRIEITEVPFDKLDLVHEAPEVLALPRREVIDHPDPFSLLDQLLYNMGSDKTRTTGYQIEWLHSSPYSLYPFRLFEEGLLSLISSSPSGERTEVRGIILLCIPDKKGEAVRFLTAKK